jgi:DMSO/TMAO reductase YedYZ molybdopterin-dependent catalytic subunit
MTADWLRRGALGGLVAGLAAAATMDLAAALLGVRSLPDLLQQPILAIMPGPVFGFLIDNLQHAGKVLEEIGLTVAIVVALTALGALAGYAAGRWSFPNAGLPAAAVAWLVVVLAILPLGGAGLFGLSQGGPTTPVIWALVFAIEGLVWGFVWNRTGPDATTASEVDVGRRRMLVLAPAGIAAGSLALIGLLKVPDWVRAVFVPPESGLSGPVPELTPAGNFYRVSKNFQDPVVPRAGWELKVSGLVDRPLHLAYADLGGLPSTTEIVTLECISNDVGGNLMSTGKFTGVPLRDLITMGAPRAGASAINFKARDGYTESLALSTVMSTPDILVAYLLNDAALPDQHGFPARVLIPGRYGMKGPKWLDEIVLATSEGGGFWEGEGWDPLAPIQTTARFDVPRDGDVLRREAQSLAGVAFAGTRGIQVVEWSADGGRTWSPAELKTPLSPLAWTLWHATWTPDREGVLTLVVRARDGGGQLQTNQAMPSFPSGASGYHAIRVNVGR